MVMRYLAIVLVLLSAALGFYFGHWENARRVLWLSVSLEGLYRLGDVKDALVFHAMASHGELEFIDFESDTQEQL